MSCQLGVGSLTGSGIICLVNALMPFHHILVKPLFVSPLSCDTYPNNDVWKLSYYGVTHRAYILTPQKQPQPPPGPSPGPLRFPVTPRRDPLPSKLRITFCFLLLFLLLGFHFFSSTPFLIRSH